MPAIKKTETPDNPPKLQSSAAPAKVGALLIDARPLASFLEDLPDGATQGMRRERDGVDDVIEEITGNQADWGAKAGIDGAHVQEIVDATDKIAQIRKHRPAVAKLLEMMDETEAKLEDRRDAILRSIAQSVDAKATSGGANVLAKYEKTRAYRSATGHKAARSRRSKAAPAPDAPKNG